MKFKKIPQTPPGRKDVIEDQILFTSGEENEEPVNSLESEPNLPSSSKEIEIWSENDTSQNLNLEDEVPLFTVATTSTIPTTTELQTESSENLVRKLAKLLQTYSDDENVVESDRVSEGNEDNYVSKLDLVLNGFQERIEVVEQSKHFLKTDKLFFFSNVV